MVISGKIGSTLKIRQQKEYLFVCFFLLMLNVPVNNFSVISGWSHRFLGITSTFRGVNVSAQMHNTAEVGIEPPNSRSGVRDSWPPRYPAERVCTEPTDTIQISQRVVSP